MSRHAGAKIILGGGLLLAAFALASGGTEGARRIGAQVSKFLHGILSAVSAHEGGFTSVNANSDGAGLSWGILQWSQATGGLGRILGAMFRRDEARFKATFGPAWSDLLKVTALGGLDPVGGYVLWSKPWTDRFRAAGADPIWQEVQTAEASRGPYWKAALAASTVLGVSSQRSLAILLDTAVQQGTGTLASLAERVAPKVAGKDERTKMEAFAYYAAAPHRRRDDPGEHPKAPRIRWVRVSDGTWHAFAGSVDLYENILDRRLGLLDDPRLSDASPSAYV